MNLLNVVIALLVVVLPSTVTFYAFDAKHKLLCEAVGQRTSWRCNPHNDASGTLIWDAKTVDEVVAGWTAP